MTPLLLRELVSKSSSYYETIVFAIGGPRGSSQALRKGARRTQTKLFLSEFEGVPGRPGRSQKEGQEDQGPQKL